uniref:Uncharacterized protein n=1 Tax=Knipowitschia caucasica TaxID=637954 RepID=A0AAV2JZY8_KNICA
MREAADQAGEEREVDEAKGVDEEDSQQVLLLAAGGSSPYLLGSSGRDIRCLGIPGPPNLLRRMMVCRSGM